jgi:hypothetical protein
MAGRPAQQVQGRKQPASPERQRTTFMAMYGRQAPELPASLWSSGGGSGRGSMHARNLVGAFAPFHFELNTVPTQFEHVWYSSQQLHELL